MNGLIVDLFAGGGGASIGIEAALQRHVDIAINHDPIAIAVHTANHPKTKHYTSNIWEVDPIEAMLQPDELKRAQFGRFASKCDLSKAKTKASKVKLLGNSVCPEVEEKVVEAQLPIGEPLPLVRAA